MNTKCRTVPKNNRCTPEVIPPSLPSCEPFNVCLSFGRALHFNGNCFTVIGDVGIADGWYSEFQVINGCIVDARGAEIPVYTPAPCAPAAGPCDDNGGGGSSLPPLSPDAKNLSYYTGGLLMTELVFGTLTGVQVTGAGTRNDPLNLTVTASGGSQMFFTNGSPDVFGLLGTGEQTSPYILTMENSPLGAGDYGAFTIDAYGRVTGYDSSAGGGTVTTVLDGDGTTAQNNAGVVQIDITATGVTSGQYDMGGYTIKVNNKGQATSIERGITITGDKYRLGGYDVTLNGFGSVTAIEEAPLDDTAVPTTFVAVFQGVASSTDTDRETSIDLPLTGLVHVEYQGFLGNIAGNPGMSLNASGVSIAIDGVVLPNAIVNTVPTATAGTVARVAVRATSASLIAAGSHTVTINGTAILTQNDGFVKCEIVGRGA